MPARLTCYVPEHAATVRVVADEEVLRLGRDPDACPLALDHPSVSRAHALLEGAPGWRLLDLDSKNGTFVDGERVHSRELQDNCWLRFGDVYCEFEPLTVAQAQALRERAEQRRATSAILQRRAAGQPDLDSLLHETLRAALELTGCDRGFLLLGEPRGMAVRATVGVDAATPPGGGFAGSFGAVARALSEGSAIVANAVGATPWLRSRESVVDAGIRALACVPLPGAHPGAVPLGAVYVDSRGDDARITALDVELLTGFVEQMALAIAARRAGDDLGAVAQGAASAMPVAGPGFPA